MDYDKLLRKYLDGELSPEEEKEALHIIAEDSELRSMLRFEQQLNEALSSKGLSLDTPSVPDGFSYRVMQQVAADESASKGFLSKLEDWYREFIRPRNIQWRPVYSLAAALLLISAFVYPLFLANRPGPPTEQAVSMQEMNQSVQKVSTEAEEVLLRFVYIDGDAQSVAVAGDFSNWKPIALNKQEVNGEQVWSGMVSLSRGEHHYMFVKNGNEWVTDPMAPVTRDDGFGNKNAVVYL